MNSYQEKLTSAVKLRESGKHEEARGLLLELHNEFPNDPQVNFGILLLFAWIHDLLGLGSPSIHFSTPGRYSPKLKNLTFF